MYMRIGTHAMIIEGITPEEYPPLVKRFIADTKKKKPSRSLDFLELLDKDLTEVKYRLIKVENFFVYNIDLFAEDVDPDKATRAMGMLRGMYQGGGMSQLMFTRPSANLDYNSRKGFTYMDNHPLGNWCEFYRIEEGRLISQAYPIRQQPLDQSLLSW